VKGSEQNSALSPGASRRETESNITEGRCKGEGKRLAVLCTPVRMKRRSLYRYCLLGLFAQLDFLPKEILLSCALLSRGHAWREDLPLHPCAPPSHQPVLITLPELIHF